MKNVLLLVAAMSLLLIAGCRRGDTGPDTTTNTTTAPQAVPEQTLTPAPDTAVTNTTAAPPPAVPEQTLTLDLGNGANMDFVIIGSEKGADDGTPVREVATAKQFYMAKHEVTQEQWKQVMGSSTISSTGPVASVTWKDCQAFMAKLKEKADGMDVRVPTEAEWEYASRAGGSAEFNYSDNEDGQGECAWVEVSLGNTSRPGSWGPYDMHGMGLVEFVQASATMTRPMVPVMSNAKQFVPTPMVPGR